MSERSIDLVTGATGHLGHTLVRHLLGAGRQVRAGVRTPSKASRLEGMDVAVVRTELQDKASLVAAMQDVDTVYAVAGAFKLWSKNPEADIIRPNIDGARNIVEAAAEAGVRKLIYVSSMTALDSSIQPYNPRTWNPHKNNPYESSKTAAEKLALELAATNGVDISTILPGAILGPDFHEINDTTNLLVTILTGKLPVDPNLQILIVDVRDVAAACHLAATRGRNRGRYIVSNTTPISTGRMIAIAQEMFPELGLKTPKRIPYRVLLGLAHLTSGIATLLGRQPRMNPDSIRLYGSGKPLGADTTKTKQDLGLEIIDSEQTMRDSLRYAQEQFLAAR